MRLRALQLNMRIIKETTDLHEQRSLFLCSYINELQMEYMLVEELAYNGDDRAKEKGHKQDSDIGLSSKDNSNDNNKKVIGNTDHCVGNLFQYLLGNDLGHGIIGRHAHVGIDVEGHRNDEA